MGEVRAFLRTVENLTGPGRGWVGVTETAEYSIFLSILVLLVH